ncbi:MAG: glycosyltransferase family 39 protein [Caldilineaceae bacterium]|nr:glycosyltransferase family 39 protein [Caldilineaceae bacterium]
MARPIATGTRPNTALPAQHLRHIPTLHSRYWLILLLLIAAALRFYALDGSSLWSDEGNTWALVQRSFAQIARDAAADIHPPGYYWLLKLWAALFGSSAAALRAFSALAGLLLVMVIYAIGRRIDALTRNRAAIALTAAWLAAINPFQLYYSQEARMYLLLALAGAGLFWALLLWIEREAAGQPVTAPAAWFVVCGALGLWTHYSFPILLSAAGLAYLWHWRALLRRQQQPTRAITRYILANLAVILAFAPWLPTAINRVLHWPQGGDATSLADGLLLSLRTLTFGPLRDLPSPLWPWLLVAAALPLLGIIALARYPQGIALAPWLLAPISLMFGLGLFSDAFLKFLLTASPAWVLLCAAAPLLLPRPRWGNALVAIGGITLAASVLPSYYTSPTVRDNYAGVAAYVKAVGDPASDLVLLNAPGQGDVWSYYAPDLPVIGLPQSRPPDPAATLAHLEEAVQDRRHVFALFWATDEADPDRIVESWLDQHAFRGLESWQGNLRFVVYTLPNQMSCTDLAPPIAFGEAIRLLAQCQPDLPQRIPAGQVALLGLQWQTQEPLTQKYKVTVQLLDTRNQVIAQHDAAPAGGSLPTNTWQPNTPITDNHGLPIPFGTPPGLYQLIVALYNDESGARLPTPAGDSYALGEVEVVRPDRALPLDVLDIPHRLDAQLGPVTLVGYDAYKKGHSFAPETPLQAGDLVHFTLYWQAPDPLPAEWPADLGFTINVGDQSLSTLLAGGDYPTAMWQSGELVRGEFDLLFDGSSDRPTLEVNGNHAKLRPLPR